MDEELEKRLNALKSACDKENNRQVDAIASLAAIVKDCVTRMDEVENRLEKLLSLHIHEEGYGCYGNEHGK